LQKKHRRLLGDDAGLINFMACVRPTR